jgi:hypothetical protein
LSKQSELPPPEERDDKQAYAAIVRELRDPAFRAHLRRRITREETRQAALDSAARALSESAGGMSRAGGMAVVVLPEDFGLELYEMMAGYLVEGHERDEVDVEYVAVAYRRVQEVDGWSLVMSQIGGV